MSQADGSIKQPEFKGIRAIFWPIHTYEVKKFLPMGLMMFCVLFNYTVLRDTKDALVVNAPGSGAEVLAFVKLYCTTPAAILFMILYAKLSNLLRPEALFYVALLPFIIFFGAFAFIIYPNKEVLHMSEATIQALQIEYPRLKWIVAMAGNWSYSLFYVLSELWGSVAVSLLFWQFANEITRVAEAKRFYGLFGMIGNFGLMLSGSAVYYFSKIRDTLSPDVDAWGVTLNYLMSFVVAAGLVVVGLYYWMNRNVLTDSRLYNPSEGAGSKKDKTRKPKLSLTESFKYLLSSPYLGLIAVIVLTYGISINVVEGVWKGQMKILFKGNPNDYNAFMGQFSFVTGVSTIILMLIGSNILRRFSWKTAAMITPVMILITSLIFFGLIIYSNNYSPFDAFLGTSMVMVTVLVGMIQNVLSKATKYSLYDTTKEMTYIPLDQELKVKGKAAVDVIGGRAGKSGGAFIQSTLLTVFAGSTLASLAPMFASVVLGISVIWLLAVTNLAKRFRTLTQEKGLKEEGKVASLA